jgi:SAM-dependent methyltransferase
MNETLDIIKQSLILSYTAEGDSRDVQTLPEWKIKERQSFVQRLSAEGKRALLEIGPATGRDGLFFAENGLAPTCIDLTPGMVRLCREKGLNAHVMDVCAMTFPPESFDAVYSVNGLVHLPKNDMKSALAAIARVLVPGGLFLNCIWGGISFEGVREKDDHVPKRYFSFYTDERARRVFGEMFTIEDFRTIDMAGMKAHLQVIWMRKA